MALDDLDLEFEDEEEVKRKKHEAVQVDVDLEFHVPDTVAKSKGARPGIPASSEEATSAPVSSPKTPPPVQEPRVSKPVAEVKKIEEIRAAAQVRKVPSSTPEAGAGQVQGSSALKIEPAPLTQGQYDLEIEEVLALREKVRQTEFEAQVKVQVAEYKMEIYGDLMGDIKIMEHQINQLLLRINAKHPDMKQEILTIKKVLADFTAKKRK
jgi:hypothetical protein